MVDGVMWWCGVVWWMVDDVVVWCGVVESFVV